MTFLLFISRASAEPADTTRVLFIGNSYTYYYDLPDLFGELSKAAGKNVEVQMSVGGGYSLEFHRSLQTTLNTLMSRPWNYVVLQEQSIYPTIEFYRQNSMYPAARSLDSLIRLRGGKTVFFMTWGRKDGGMLCIAPYCSTLFRDFAQMQDTIDAAYAAIANELSALLCPVGMAWKLALQENPSAPLWEDDGSHPSAAGSYLAACTFYALLYGSSPEGLTYFGGLSQFQATTYQRLAYNATKLYVSSPAEFVLHQNYPNPFRTRTTITYSLPRRGSVLLDFYNALGQRVGPEVEEVKGPGTFDAEFYAGSVASGMYIYRLEFEGKATTGKMVLVK
ncbi:MAG: SGNH/GDSL hydrolase family protein [Bacteroidota bacterium]|jgi:hypothetical protein